jgi:hypothetical protein
MKCLELERSSLSFSPQAIAREGSVRIETCSQAGSIKISQARIAEIGPIKPVVSDAHAVGAVWVGQKVVIRISHQEIGQIQARPNGRAWAKEGEQAVDDEVVNCVVLLGREEETEFQVVRSSVPR